MTDREAVARYICKTYWGARPMSVDRGRAGAILAILEARGWRKVHTKTIYVQDLPSKKRRGKR